MQVKVSKDLDKVLQDKEAREQLRDLLIEGRNGCVKVGEKPYKVKTQVRGNKNS